jgi:hypothetical protein
MYGKPDGHYSVAIHLSVKLLPLIRYLYSYKMDRENILGGRETVKHILLRLCGAVATFPLMGIPLCCSRNRVEERWDERLQGKSV